MTDDADSPEFARGRLSGAANEVYLRDYRVPQWEVMMEYFWEPLLMLNRAQAIALEEADVLTAAERDEILDCFDDLEAGGVETVRESNELFEDPYLYMEGHLVDQVGEDVGGKIHIGRSRNDLFGAAVRIIMRRQLLDLVESLLDLRETILDRAADSMDVVLPAYTHSQPAQPITLAHYLLGFDHLLSRDFERLRRAFENTNRSPLGAAAIGGTGFPLNRHLLATLAGFDDIEHNTYDAISSVDFVPEATSALALLLTNVSRISHDLVEWSTFEFDFIEHDDSLSTVSSIMPQKKNPSVLEKTRTTASDAIGAATSSFTHLRGGRYGDSGERSRYVFLSFFDEVEDGGRTLRLLDAIIDTMETREERMLDVAEESFCTMTELADTLVREFDFSFRVAHEVVSMLVRDVHNDGRTAGEITVEDVERAAQEAIGQEIGITMETLKRALDPKQNVEQRDIVGGTAPQRSEEDLTRQYDSLDDQREWLTETHEGLAGARTLRREAGE